MPAIKARTGVRALTSLAAVCLLGIGTAAASPLHLFMAPNGNDSNSGRSTKSAVQSLARIKAIVNALPANFSDDIFVEIASGTYLDQSVVWTRTIPGHWITFEAIDPASRPLFDGSSLPTQSWFEAVGLGVSQIQLRHLHVRNYVHAVVFHGSDHNELYGMKLEYIGGIGNGSGGFGALHLRDSSDNSITNSHFIGIAIDPDTRNDRTCGGLHAIYASDSSSRNVISGNWFEDSCGAGVVKFRNGSNDNLIAGNRFLHSGSGAYVFVAANYGVECKPLGNWFQYNEVCNGFFDQSMSFVGTSTVGDPPGCEPETSDRVPVRTRGNVYVTSATRSWCRSLTQAEINRRHLEFDDL